MTVQVTPYNKKLFRHNLIENEKCISYQNKAFQLLRHH